MGLTFRLVRASEAEIGTGEIIPLLGTFPAPLDWASVRRLDVGTTPKKLCDRSGGRRVIVMLQNLNAAVALFIDVDKADIARKWRIAAGDVQAIPHTGELWGYAASTIELNVWEGFLQRVES